MRILVNKWCISYLQRMLQKQKAFDKSDSTLINVKVSFSKGEGVHILIK